MTEYPAGTVAIATVRGVHNVRAWSLGDGDWWTAERGRGGWLHHREHVTHIRPLVVLDLGDYDDRAVIYLRNLARESRDVFGQSPSPRGKLANLIADQIEAQTRPPKSAEPTGLGAVVVDSKHGPLVRTVAGSSVLDTSRPWRAPDGCYYSWADFDAEEVLSEGVTE